MLSNITILKLIEAIRKYSKLSICECADMSNMLGDTFSIKKFKDKLQELSIHDIEVHNTYVCVKKSNFLFSEDCLRKLSYPISLEQSTNKLKVTPAILEVVSHDVVNYAKVLETNDSLYGVDYRVKTVSSIHGKAERYPDKHFQSVFNDLLGIRFHTKDYLQDIPDYVRYVDMTNGKKVDDGYRAQHFYYKLDNMHYIIEIQIWNDDNYNFNKWSHLKAYKHVPPEVLRRVRDKYDQGKLKTLNDFVKEVKTCQELTL